MKIFFIVFISLPIDGKLRDHEKVDFCETLECDEGAEEKVCGVKYGDEEVIFKLFDNECKLLKYGCQVNDSETDVSLSATPKYLSPVSHGGWEIQVRIYRDVVGEIERKSFGIINMKHCTTNSTTESDNVEHVRFVNTCTDCIDEGDPVCGIRQDGPGFKIRTFKNECWLNRYNCGGEVQFTITDYFICSNDSKLKDIEEDQIYDEEVLSTTPMVNGPNNSVKTKNLVVVDGSMLNPRNINESIRHFFAATHVLDLPMRDIQPMFNESTRRRLIKIFGPIKVFTPWVKIPKNVSDDHEHEPTLSSCYHKCPTKCPDTYAPVCGVPGVVAREPSLMFQNHCYMDVAQCKMYWEDKSATSQSSAYIESSFLFCLGDELNGLYRFLPLIKTLQHMGRLKSRGRYRYKFRNMKFFNNLMARQPKLMG